MPCDNDEINDNCPRCEEQKKELAPLFDDVAPDNGIRLAWLFSDMPQLGRCPLKN